MVYVLLGNGFEEIEAVTAIDLLRRGGVSVQTVGIGGREIPGSHKIPVLADITLQEAEACQAEMIVLPGGLKGVQSIQKSKEALQLIKDVWETGAYVAAICAAPTVLAALHLTDGKHAVCYPGMENQMGSAKMEPGVTHVQDGKLITGRSAGGSVPFALKLLETLRGEEEAKRVGSGIVYEEANA